MRLTNFSTKAGSRKMREKPKLSFNLFLIIFVFSPIFITPLMAQDLAEKSQGITLTPEVKDNTSPVRNTEFAGLNTISNGTRIVITTSGPAKFKSYWLDTPPRLVVEFQTRNIVSKIDNEIMVNQGVIKRITSEYFESSEKKSLKSLTFELMQKVPYKIWQEADTILLDIQTTQEMSVFPEEGKEVFAKNETKEAMIKRLEAMESVLTKVSANHPPPAVPKATKVIAEFPKDRRKSKMGMVFWLIGLALISGLGLLAWLFWRRYKLILDKDIATQEIAKFKSELAEKNKLLEQEEIIRKTVENTSIKKEKEFEQVKVELQKEKQLLEQEEKARKTMEEELSKKEKEVTEAKGSLESLKEVLVEKGIAKKLTTPEKEGELWIAGKSAERREFPRLDLSKDYSRTIILRIESQDKSKSIKSFANNIGLGGLCFDARSDFKEKDRINLRLFFFGDKVPMMRFQAKVIRKKIESPVNRYGVSFNQLEEKDKTELNRYIESKIARG